MVRQTWEADPIRSITNNANTAITGDTVKMSGRDINPAGPRAVAAFTASGTLGTPTGSVEANIAGTWTVVGGPTALTSPAPLTIEVPRWPQMRLTVASNTGNTINGWIYPDTALT